MYARHASQVIPRGKKMENNELQQLVEEISMKFFQKPFFHKAYFNKRLRATGGRYLVHNSNIEINYGHYEEHGQEEVVNIIKHELCHYHLHLEGKGYRHRDRDFRQLMKEVNAPRFCQPLAKNIEKKQNSPIHLYQCTGCKIKYTRKRKIQLQKYRCGYCNGMLKKIE